MPASGAADPAPPSRPDRSPESPVPLIRVGSLDARPPIVADFPAGDTCVHLSAAPAEASAISVTSVTCTDAATPPRTGRRQERDRTERNGGQLTEKNGAPADLRRSRRTGGARQGRSTGEAVGGRGSAAARPRSGTRGRRRLGPSPPRIGVAVYRRRHAVLPPSPAAAAAVHGVVGRAAAGA